MHADVLIIGSGAGGGTLAWHLAPSGKKIVLLERGGYLPRERQNFDSKAVFVDNRYVAEESWLDRNGKPFRPGIHYYVGGNTKFYGAALLRLRPQDFGEVVHHDGVSPAWPVSYETFEPWYTKAEHLYRVHGQHGTDPTEGSWSAQYAYPALRHEPRIQQMVDDLRKLGHHPFPLALGVMLDEDRLHQSRCIRCGTCDGFPCLLNAKCDAQTVCVDPALAHDNVTLVTGALVTRLETSQSGREVTRVIVTRGGAEEVYTADIVVVACGAINSAALLLRSASEQHPQGLANRSGMVGRNYMCHTSSALMAISTVPNPTIFQKTFNLNDFLFGADGWPYPLGNIQGVGKSDAAMLAGEAPIWGPHLVFDEMAKHSIDFWLTTEDLPKDENRVTVDRDGAITLSYTPNNVEAHQRLTQKLKGLLSHIACEDKLFGRSMYMNKVMGIGATAHQAGTVRFGVDPDTSALDTDCKAHDLDNLYVVDASFFPSIGAQNPSLTIMANALRVGDHLLGRLTGN